MATGTSVASIQMAILLAFLSLGQCRYSSCFTGGKGSVGGGESVWASHVGSLPFFEEFHLAVSHKHRRGLRTLTLREPWLRTMLPD